jgi:CheY-like chemotaxis protein
MSTVRAPLVMIAEDDADDQLMLRQAFRHVGYEGEMEFCRDGAELVQRLQQAGRRLPSLVLLDLKMPRMGGLEALQTIRADPHLKGLPVITFTTSDMPRDVRTAYELGANAYLRKPVGLDALREIVSALKRFWLDLATLPDTA